MNIFVNKQRLIMFLYIDELNVDMLADTAENTILHRAARYTDSSRAESLNQNLILGYFTIRWRDKRIFDSRQ